MRWVPSALEWLRSRICSLNEPINSTELPLHKLRTQVLRSVAAGALEGHFRGAAAVGAKFGERRWAQAGKVSLGLWPQPGLVGLGVAGTGRGGLHPPFGSGS